MLMLIVQNSVIYPYVAKRKTEKYSLYSRAMHLIKSQRFYLQGKGENRYWGTPGILCSKQLRTMGYRLTECYVGVPGKQNAKEARLKK